MLAYLSVLAAAGLPAQPGYRAAAGHTDNIRLAARILAAHERPGDAVLYVPPWWRQISATYPSSFSRLSDIALAKTPAQAGNFTGTQLPPAQIRGKLAADDRVWLIDFPRFRPLPLPSGWHIAAQWHAGDFVLTLYQRASAPGLPGGHDLPP